MTINDIVQATAGMCNIELGTPQDDPRYGKIKAAVEYAIVEALRVLKKKRTETVGAVGGLISYSAFSKGVVELLALRRNGRRIKWAETEDGFFIGGGDAEIEAEYVACPLSILGTDSPPVSDQIFAHRNYAYFAASEFLAAEARHTDARAFQARWERALYHMRGRRRMPFGGWV